MTCTKREPGTRRRAQFPYVEHDGLQGSQPCLLLARPVARASRAAHQECDRKAPSSFMVLLPYSALLTVTNMAALFRPMCMDPSLNCVPSKGAVMGALAKIRFSCAAPTTTFEMLAPWKELLAAAFRGACREAIQFAAFDHACCASVVPQCVGQPPRQPGQEAARSIGAPSLLAGA